MRLQSKENNRPKEKPKIDSCQCEPNDIWRFDAKLNRVIAMWWHTAYVRSNSHISLGFIDIFSFNYKCVRRQRTSLFDCRKICVPLASFNDWICLFWRTFFISVEFVSSIGMGISWLPCFVQPMVSDKTTIFISCLGLSRRKIRQDFFGFWSSSVCTRSHIHLLIWCNSFMSRFLSLFKLHASRHCGILTQASAELAPLPTE